MSRLDDLQKTLESEYSATCAKETELEGAGISLLSVRVSALPSLGSPRGGYEGVLEEIEGKECERLPSAEGVACLSLEENVKKLEVGQGAYRVVVSFRFVEASEKQSRRFAEEAAARISRVLLKGSP